MTANLSSKDPGVAFDIGTGVRTPDPNIVATGRVPNDIYYSDEQYQLELDNIFSKTWLNVARTAEIPLPGNFVVKEYLGLSMLITRGTDGNIRAFHNVCTHRSTKLVWEESGRKPSFLCPFHAWCFSTDGKLLHVPDQASFPKLDFDESRLASINCEVYGTFIFINLQESPTQSLSEFLGDWGTRHEGLPWEDYEVVGYMSGVSELNWKLGVEIGTETYHAFQLHKHSLGHLIPKNNPYLHQPEIDFYGPHGAYTMPGNPDFKIPESNIYQQFVAANFIPAGRMGDTAKNGGATFANHPGMNFYKAEDFGSTNYIIFPNMLMVASGALGWHVAHYWPLGPNKTFWEMRFSYFKPTTWRERFAQTAMMTNNRDASFEDTSMAVAQQPALRSGAVKQTQFNDWTEWLPRHQAACISALTYSDVALQEAAE